MQSILRFMCSSSKDNVWIFLQPLSGFNGWSVTFPLWFEHPALELFQLCWLDSVETHSLIACSCLLALSALRLGVADQKNLNGLQPKLHLQRHEVLWTLTSPHLKRVVSSRICFRLSVICASLKAKASGVVRHATGSSCTQGKQSKG